jgi:hypothetical protein
MNGFLTIRIFLQDRPKKCSIPKRKQAAINIRIKK